MLLRPTKDSPLILLACSWVLVACSGAPKGPAEPNREPPATAFAPAQLEGIELRYSWEGGYGPGTVRLVVRGAGKSTLALKPVGQSTVEKHVVIPAEHVRRLLQEFRRARFFSVRVKPREDHYIHDLGRFTVSIKLDNRSHQAYVDGEHLVSDPKGFERARRALLSLSDRFGTKFDWGPYGTATVRRERPGAPPQLDPKCKRYARKDKVQGLLCQLKALDGQRAVIRELARLGPRVLPHLEPLLVRGDHVRTRAVMVIGKIGPSARRMVPALTKIIDADFIGDETKWAIWALGRIGPAARPAAVLIIKHYQRQKAYRAEMLVALSEIGPESFYALVTAPKTELESYPMGKVAAFKAVPVLTRALAHNEAAVRARTLKALGFYDKKAAASTSAVAGLLTDADANVRTAAAACLTRIGKKARRAGAALVDGLGDDDPRVREAAAMALAAVDYRPAVPRLLKALNDPNKEVRGQAAFSLSYLKPTSAAAATALGQALEDDATRFGALRTLSGMGSAALPAIPALERLLENAKTPEQKQPVAALLRKLKKLKASRGR